MRWANGALAGVSPMARRYVSSSAKPKRSDRYFSQVTKISPCICLPSPSHTPPPAIPVRGSSLGDEMVFSRRVLPSTHDSRPLPKSNRRSVGGREDADAHKSSRGHQERLPVSRVLTWRAPERYVARHSGTLRCGGTRRMAHARGGTPGEERVRW